MRTRFLIVAILLGIALTAFLLASPQAGAREYKYLDSAGIRIAYLEQGRGEPVILLHGGLADSEQNWVQFGIMDALAKDHRAIALDLRGHGRSGKPHGVENYGRLMAQDVLNLMDELKIDKAHLLGYSIGSLVALTLVADHPERVLSAAFGGPGWIRPDTDMSVYTNTAASLEAGKGLRPMFEGYRDGQGNPISEKEMAQIDAALGRTNDLLAIATALRGIAGLVVLEPDLRRARVPCLFLYGTKDDNRKDIPLLRAALSANAEFVEIPGAAHGDAIARPEFKDAVLRFFSSRPVSK